MEKNKWFGVPHIEQATKYISFIDEDEKTVYRVEGSNKDNLTLKYGNKESYKNVPITRDYYNIEHLFDDHYIVCDVAYDGILSYDAEFDNSKLSFKYGIIVLQRDEQNKIIPMQEKIVVPILYDRISTNNENTVTAYLGQYLTYIDVNPNSEHYGKQLVPIVLEHAVPFSVDYEGFAECSVNGVVGYLPRNCKPKDTLKPSDLLTEDQVKVLSNETLYSNALTKFEELTGSPKVFKKIKISKSSI